MNGEEGDAKRNINRKTMSQILLPITKPHWWCGGAQLLTNVTSETVVWLHNLRLIRKEKDYTNIVLLVGRFVFYRVMG